MNATPPSTPVSTDGVYGTSNKTFSASPQEPAASYVKPPAKRRPWRVAAAIAAAVLLILGVAAAYWFGIRRTIAPEPRVKIGLMMAFTGGSSAMGYGATKGIQLAQKQLGADNIEVVRADSKCDPKKSAEAIKHLIEQKVVAIIGEGCSSASVAALPAANNAKIPMISPSASSPALSIPGDYFYRVVPPDTLQGSFMAEAIHSQGINSVAVFYTNEPYGSGMNKIFQEDFEALGGRVVATAAAEPDVIDLAEQMRELKNGAPQAVFFSPNSVVSGTAAIKLAREAGLRVPFFGADIFYDSTIIQNAPDAVEGLTVTSFSTGNKTFKQALVNEFKVTEQLYAAPQAYDAFNAIYKAVRDKGARSGEDIKRALDTTDFQGVSAHIRFDRNGEISDKNYTYDLFQVRDGKFMAL